MKTTHFKIYFEFNWFDFWIGIFYSRDNHRLYLQFVPMITIVIQLPSADPYMGAENQPPYFCEAFCLEIPTKTLAEMVWIKANLNLLKNQGDDSEYYQTLITRNTICIQGIYGVGDGLIDMLMKYLKLYNPTKYIGISVAIIANEFVPRGDGGEAIFITANHVDSFTTQEWIAKKAMRRSNTDTK